VRGQIQDGRQSTGSNVQTRLILELNSVKKTFKVSFPTKFGMAIRLVILLRSPGAKEMHFDQGQGQITLKTFGHSFGKDNGLDLCNIAKLRFHFDTIGIIIQKN